jgi:hypothetical protein
MGSTFGPDNPEARSGRAFKKQRKEGRQEVRGEESRRRAAIQTQGTLSMN